MKYINEEVKGFRSDFYLMMVGFFMPKKVVIGNLNILKS